MKKELKGLQILLAYWIKSDTTLWTELEDGHIKLLHHRFVKHYSYERIAFESKLKTTQVSALLEAVICIIERSHGFKLADFLREINLCIEAEKPSSKREKTGFDSYQIWLN